jgi:energy-converting hydrogenase Eha subunit A
MPRLILLEVVVFLGAFGVSYLLRSLLGRRIQGPPVALWGAFFGMLGALGSSYLVESVLEGARFLWTDANIWGILAIAFRFFFLTAVIGGVLGAVVASFPRGRRKDGSGQNSG